LSFNETAVHDAEKSGGALSKALEKPIDILFYDMHHDPHSVLALLARYLPFMAPSSSIFIDSASTHAQTYMTLEQTVDQMNRGKMPSTFVAGTDKAQRERLEQVIRTRKFTLIHCVENKDRVQNSHAWIKIDPVDVVPYPLTHMHGSNQLANVPAE